MPIGIAGKRIIVTGGARGIAAAAVKAFVEEGAQVVSFDNRSELGRAVAEEASTAGPGRAWFQSVELTDQGAVRSAVDQAVATLGGLEALFNIAAIERTANAEDIGAAGWAPMLAVNITGVAFMCEAAFPYLKERGGTIVNFSSDTAFQPYRGGAHYSATKGAIISYTRTIATEWAKYNIRANCVLPAARSPMFNEKRDRLPESEHAAYEARIDSLIPLGRVGDPQKDIAPLLVFLASDGASYISAQNIGVNGGSAWGR